MSTADPLLVLDQVFAGYGKMTILNGTTAHIRRGAITTVIGPNGAGKSTMFKTIFGLLPVRSGTITFDGRATTNFAPRQILRRRRRLYPARPQYFSGAQLFATIWSSAELPCPIRRACRAAWIRSCSAFRCCSEKADAQASTLSGGQQKMLEVARGLLLDPKLILIDEPSIGLSPLMVQEVFAILKSLRDNGVTILLIEQNAKQALQISDYGLVLEQGQTRIEDTAPNILADPRIAQLFLGGGLAQPERVS